MLRCTQIFELVANLSQLAELFSITPAFSTNHKTAAQLRSAAKKETEKKKQIISRIFLYITDLFQTKDGQIAFPAPNSRIHAKILRQKDLTRLLKMLNMNVNQYNMWHLNLRALTPSELAKLSQLEQLIAQHPLPHFDLTNGFQTPEQVTAHIEALMNPSAAFVHNHETYDETDIPAETPFQLRDSRRNVLCAYLPEEVADFMGLLLHYISVATLLEPSEMAQVFYDFANPEPRRSQRRVIRRQPTPRGFRFMQDGTVNGKWPRNVADGFSLKLDFRDGHSLPSSCEEVSSRFQSQADLDRFNSACSNRIRTLLSLDAERTHRMIVFCEHPGCNYAEEGFIFSRRREGASRHRVSPACPDGHAFCISCKKAPHEGSCVTLDAEQQREVDEGRAKLCPTCKALIFKDGGCNHMECTNCGQHFCWLCFMCFTASERYVEHAIIDGVPTAVEPWRNRRHVGIPICPQFSN
jgi:hypothetical protein